MFEVKGYLGGFKKYKVDTISGLKKVLGDIANDIVKQIQQESIEIARETLQETVYKKQESEYYNRSGELLNTPMIYDKWKNAYGSGFTLAYDTTVLSTFPKYRVRDDNGWKTMLGQHEGVKREDVRDYVMTWLNEGFTIIGSNEEYEGAHFKEITQDKIRQRIEELINSMK